MDKYDKNKEYDSIEKDWRKIKVTENRKLRKIVESVINLELIKIIKRLTLNWIKLNVKQCCKIK